MEEIIVGTQVHICYICLICKSKAKSKTLTAMTSLRNLDGNIALSAETSGTSSGKGFEYFLEPHSNHEDV